MDAQTFKNIVKDRLGGRASDTSLDDIIDRQADILQDALEQSGKKYDFQITEYNNTVTAGSSTPQEIELPKRYLSLAYEGSLRLYNSDGELVVVLARRPFDELAFHSNPQNVQVAASTPIHYAILNGKIYVFPYLDQDYTLKFHYHETASKISGLADTETNYWLTNAGDWFVARVGIVMATQVIKDADALQLFNAQAVVADHRLETRQAALEQEDFDAGMETL